MNGFTIYEDYFELITLLSVDEQGQLLLAICNYMFADKEPELSENQMKVFKNLKRPLNKSKEQSKRASKRKPTENQTDIQMKTEQNRNEHPSEYPNENTSNDVNVYVNDNVNNLEELGYGEEKPLTTDDTGLLAEIVEKDLTNNYSFPKEIVDHLNDKAGTEYRYTTKATQQKINARLNEGYTLDDFIAVIDKKVADWKGTDMAKYLRPQTLFGTNFESYLNQPISEKKFTTKDLQDKIDFSNF